MQIRLKKCQFTKDHKTKERSSPNQNQKFYLQINCKIYICTNCLKRCILENQRTQDRKIKSGKMLKLPCGCRVNKKQILQFLDLFRKKDLSRAIPIKSDVLRQSGKQSNIRSAPKILINPQKSLQKDRKQGKQEEQFVIIERPDEQFYPPQPYSLQIELEEQLHIQCFNCKYPLIKTKLYEVKQGDIAQHVKDQLICFSCILFFVNQKKKKSNCKQTHKKQLSITKNSQPNFFNANPIKNRFLNRFQNVNFQTPKITLSNLQPKIKNGPFSFYDNDNTTHKQIEKTAHFFQKSFKLINFIELCYFISKSRSNIIQRYSVYGELIHYLPAQYRSIECKAYNFLIPYDCSLEMIDGLQWKDYKQVLLLLQKGCEVKKSINLFIALKFL